MELRDDAAALALSSHAVQLARDRGALTALLQALDFHMFNLVLTGRIAAAEAAMAEGRAIAAATGNLAFFGSEAFVRLKALPWGGDEARTRELAAAATRETVQRGMGGAIQLIRRQVALLELARGNYEAALDGVQTVYDADIFVAGTLSLPDLIEAAVRCEEHAVGAAALGRLSERSLASGTELALGLLARSRALLADDDAEAFYREAIEHLERCGAIASLTNRAAHILTKVTDDQ